MIRSTYADGRRVGAGHWSPVNAAAAAVRRGASYPVLVTHDVGDSSGRDRSGHDGRYEVQPNGVVRVIECWAEGRQIVFDCGGPDCTHRTRRE